MLWLLLSGETDIGTSSLRRCSLSILYWPPWLATLAYCLSKAATWVLVRQLAEIKFEVLHAWSGLVNSICFYRPCWYFTIFRRCFVIWCLAWAARRAFKDFLRKILSLWASCPALNYLRGPLRLPEDELDPFTAWLCRLSARFLSFCVLVYNLVILFEGLLINWSVYGKTTFLSPPWKTTRWLSFISSLEFSDLIFWGVWKPDFSFLMLEGRFASTSESSKSFLPVFLRLLT